MPSNIEIKARARNWDKQRQQAAELADQPIHVLDQSDTFFDVPAGRLKLRRIAGEPAELIAYSRPDRAAVKQSDYHIYPTTNPDLLLEVISAACKPTREVVKQRTLYMIGQTRIHFDQVKDLGQFIELEVVMRPEQRREHGAQIATQLMKRLDIHEEDLIDVAYVDLLETRALPS